MITYDMIIKKLSKNKGYSEYFNKYFENLLIKKLNNIYECILFSLKNDYRLSYINDENNHIDEYKHYLYDKYSKKLIKNKNLLKKDIKNLLNKNDINFDILQYISDIENINILLCDSNNNKINSFFTNKNNKTIIINSYNNELFLIFDDNNYYFEKDLNLYNDENLITYKTNYDLNKYNKMKKQELIEILNNLNIKYNLKHKKDELIKLILENI
jgi:hypothetical protein